MENIDKDTKRLARYGFYVHEFLSYRNYFVTLFSHTTAYFLLLFIIFLLFGGISNIFLELGILLPIDTLINHVLEVLIFIGTPLLSLFITYKYIYYRFIVINSENIIGNNRVYTSLKDLPVDLIFLSKNINEMGMRLFEWLKKIPRLKLSKTYTSQSLKSDGETYMAIIFMWIGAWIILGFSFLLSLLFFFFGLLVKSILQSSSSLLRFSNLIYKLQKITPEITSKSKLLKESFSKDLNFNVISENFDSLAKTFTQIIALMIKLENVEKRANKGNLFDSEKYINSLRTDIVEPLKSLRLFLERQRDQLLESQKELQRVRVGGRDPEISSGGQKHSELSSKRSELLQIELTENIEKLTEMIDKMEGGK